MITLKIKVTKEIIQRAKYCDGGPKHIKRHCAVALAVRDIFPQAEVSEYYINPFGREGFVSQIELPRTVTRWINKFDGTNTSGRARMKEIEFEIKVPAYVIRKINIEEIKDLLKNHPNLELVAPTNNPSL